MNNNDILIRVRYALDIRDRDMVKIFKKGGVDLSLEDVMKLLSKTENSYNYEADEDDTKSSMECSNYLLETFLNGLIISRRGQMKSKTGENIESPMLLKEGQSPNNVLLKKLKIALNLTSDDIIKIFEKVDIKVTQSELSAFFRKEDHKHYRQCLDKYARSFLKGLSKK